MKEPYLVTTNNVHPIKDTRRRREVQEQQQVAADAILNVARELRRLEKLTDGNHGNGGSDRAS